MRHLRSTHPPVGPSDQSSAHSARNTGLTARTSRPISWVATDDRLTQGNLIFRSWNADMSHPACFIHRPSVAVRQDSPSAAHGGAPPPDTVQSTGPVSRELGVNVKPCKPIHLCAAILHDCPLKKMFCVTNSECSVGETPYRFGRLSGGCHSKRQKLAFRRPAVITAGVDHEL